MKLLSIDPGKTTGYCFYNLYDATIIYGQSLDYSINEELNDLFLKLSKNEKVIIEQPPAQGNDPKLVEFFGELLAKSKELNLEVITILPGNWKPWAKLFGTAANLLVKKQKHARDSWLMLFYYICKEDLG